MAFVHGKNTYVSLDANVLSSFCKTTEFNRSADDHDNTCYGQDGHVYEGGLTDGTVTIGGRYDSTTSGPHDVIVPLLGTIVTLILRQEGTGSGLPEDSMSVLVKSYGESLPVDDYVAWTCELKISGSVTSGNQS